MKNFLLTIINFLDKKVLGNRSVFLIFSSISLLCLYLYSILIIDPDRYFNGFFLLYALTIRETFTFLQNPFSGYSFGILFNILVIALLSLFFNFKNRVKLLAWIIFIIYFYLSLPVIDGNQLGF